MYVYIYTPEGPGVLRWRSGGVGWGGACYRHVHVTLMLRWWEGWGGVGHVTVMFSLLYRMKTQKSPDCQHLQFSTHCQFIANNSAKVAWCKMPEKTQYICSILHDHALTIRWKFTILHQNMRFLTSENMIYGTRWLCFKTDEKKMIRSTWCWKGRCHYWKLGKLPRRQLFFYMLTLKHSWWHRRTSVPSRIYIYIYISTNITGAAHLVDG